MTLDFVFLKKNISVEFTRSVQFMRHVSIYMKYEDVSDFLTCPVTKLFVTEVIEIQELISQTLKKC